MFCGSISWFICIFVAVVTATNYSDPGYITGSDLEATFYDLTTDNPESTTLEPAEEVKEIASKELGDLLDAGASAMVTLVSGDTRLVAHRAVLAARSHVFARMFGHDTTTGASSTQVAIPDVEGSVLRQLLAYMYTLQAPQLPGMAPQLLAAADRYGLPDLKAECERQVAEQLSVDTAVATAVLAVRHSCNNLTQAAVTFIRAHIFRVMSTQHWANAMHSQPDVLIEVIHLLSQPPAETSTMSPESSSTTPSTQSARDSSDHSQTTATAEPATARCPSPPPGDAAVSRLRKLSAAEKGRRLILAAKQGAVEQLQELLAAGADVGASKESGLNALHWAVARGQEGVVRCLLAAGADVEARDSEQYTALHWAARMGHAKVARLLVEGGANVGARGARQSTPLHWAAQRNHPDVVRLLAAASADLNARSQGGWAPLHDAAYHGQTEAVVALLEAGADGGAKDDWGNTPLDFARQNEHQQVVDILSRS